MLFNLGFHYHLEVWIYYSPRSASFIFCAFVEAKHVIPLATIIYHIWTKQQVRTHLSPEWRRVHSVVRSWRFVGVTSPNNSIGIIGGTKEGQEVRVPSIIPPSLISMRLSLDDWVEGKNREWLPLLIEMCSLWGVLLRLHWTGVVIQLRRRINGYLVACNWLGEWSSAEQRRMPWI